MEEKITRVGIIGCGGIANNKHMPSLAKVPNCEMVAFCDIILEKAEHAAKKFGTPDAKVYADYNELLANPEVEVVHVLTLGAVNVYIDRSAVIGRTVQH